MDRAQPSYWRGQLARNSAAAAIALCGCLLVPLMFFSQWAGCLIALGATLTAALVLLSSRPRPAVEATGLPAPVQRHPSPPILDGPDDWRHFAAAFERLRAAAGMALGCAEVLTADSRPLPDDRRAEFNRTLLDNCRAMSGLIAELDDLLRLAGGALALADQQIDAADLAEVALKRCIHAAEREDVTMRVDLIDGVELRGDSLRLRQALEGLTLHAIALAREGTVGVRMMRCTGGGLAFQLRADTPRGGPRDGSAGGPWGGSPGLTVARRIALLHGGDVTIALARAHETELRLIFPAERVTWPQVAGRSGSSAA